MFTGLIEEVGIIKSVRKNSNYASIEIKAKKVLEGLKIGDSISTNGVCLTVTEFTSETFTVDIMPESIKRSNLKDIKYGSRVNLERAMKLGDRFGGHIVSGHIDGVGLVKSYKNDGNAVWIEVEVGRDIIKYIVFKGSITLDGASVTVAEVEEDSFKVSIIPLTGEETNLLEKKVGDSINVECDLVGKYIENILNPFIEQNSLKTKIDENFLEKNGFL